MKENLLCGMLIGIVAGALLYKYNDTAKELLNKGEKTVKKELNKVSSGK